MSFIGVFMLVSVAVLMGVCLSRAPRTWNSGGDRGPNPFKGRPLDPPGSNGRSRLHICECGRACRATSEANLNAQHWRLVYGSPCCPHCLDKPAPAHLYEEEDSA